MTREEVRAFIKSGFEALSKVVPFGNGRLTEFNSHRSNTYPSGWLESLSATTALTESNLPYDDWNIVIHIAEKDFAGSKPEQYEAIVDRCDLIAQQLVKKYNAIVTGYKLVTLSSIERNPFIHKQADDTTGVILSFTLTAPDTTNVC